MSWLSEALNAAKPRLLAVLIRVLVLVAAAVAGEQLEPVEAGLEVVSSVL